MGKCKICGEEKSHDRGMMYCGICSDCCRKNRLCEDCGQPIDSPVFACTGWHNSMAKGEQVRTPYMETQESYTQEKLKKYQEALKLIRDFLERLEAPEEVKTALSIIAHPPRSEWI